MHLVFSLPSSFHTYLSSQLRPTVLCVLVAQSCPTLPPGSSISGISQGKNTGVGCHFFLQGTFLTQGSNPPVLCLLHCRFILYPLSHWGNLITMGKSWVSIRHIRIAFRPVLSLQYLWVDYTSKRLKEFLRKTNTFNF